MRTESNDTTERVNGELLRLCDCLRDRSCGDSMRFGVAITRYGVQRMRWARWLLEDNWGWSTIRTRVTRWTATLSVAISFTSWRARSGPGSWWRLPSCKDCWLIFILKSKCFLFHWNLEWRLKKRNQLKPKINSPLGILPDVAKQPRRAWKGI